MIELRVGTSRLDEIAQINLEARTELERALGAISDRENVARRLLDECAKDKKKIEFKLAALAQVEDLYRSVFGVTDTPEETRLPRPRIIIQSKHHPQSRARIGPQRYRMLKLLELQASVGLGMRVNDLAAKAQLDVRRVRDQLATDLLAGIVSEEGGAFHITEAGISLISDFEESRRNRGVPLPSLEGPLDGPDQAEVSGELYSLRQPIYGSDDGSPKPSSPAGEADDVTSRVDVSDL